MSNPDNAPMIDRCRYIGGSDIGAICGCDAYRTPLDVWRVKTGRDTFKETPETLRGQLLESGVREMLAASLGVEIHNWNIHLIHPDFPYIACTPDAYFVGEGGNTVGVEIKTYAGYYDEESIFEKHLPAIMQCNWCMWVTGRKSWVLGWMDSELSIKHVILERNDELIALMGQCAHSFWYENIVGDVPPDPIRPDDFRDVVRGSSVAANMHTAALVDDYRALGREISAMQSRRDLLGNQIKMIIGNAEELLFGVRIIATWRENKHGTRTLLTK